MSKRALGSTWGNVQQLPPRKFSCGYCDIFVASDRGYASDHPSIRMYICPHCQRPTFFEENSQFPGVAFGEKVDKLPSEISSLYDEARICCSATAYTAAVLVLRKLLMNVAVNKGAAENLKFIEYVEHLSNHGYVPPDGKGWVDHIRRKGNEATHEILLMTEADAADLVTFAEMLLKFIYEFPSKVAPPPVKP